MAGKANNSAGTSPRGMTDLRGAGSVARRDRVLALNGNLSLIQHPIGQDHNLVRREMFGNQRQGFGSLNQQLHHDQVPQRYQYRSVEKNNIFPPAPLVKRHLP